MSGRNKLSLISCAVGGVITGWAAKMGMEKVVQRLKKATGRGGGSASGKGYAPVEGNDERPPRTLDSPLGSSMDEGDLSDDDFKLDNPHNDPDLKACNFFKRTGRCSNGHACRYAHRFSDCNASVRRRVLLGRQYHTTSTSARRTVAVLHPGEMGISLAACLLRRGHRVLWCGEGRSSATRLRAESFGLIEKPSLKELVAEADVVISLVPAAEAVAVAQQVAAAWSTNVQEISTIRGILATEDLVPPVYLELNTVSPTAVTKIQTELQEAGIVNVVDGGIIGPPAWDMGTTRLYLSGDIYVNTIIALFEDIPIPPLEESDQDSDAPAADDAATPSTEVADTSAPSSTGDVVQSDTANQEPGPQTTTTTATKDASESPNDESAIEEKINPDSIRPAYFQVIDMHKALGASSALVMANAAWVKGSTALLISVHALAESLDVRKHLEEEWKRSQPGLSLFSRRKIPVAARKAWSFEVCRAAVDAESALKRLLIDGLFVGVCDLGGNESRCRHI